ncbi:hypothetical protein [Pseudomonas syringae group genomosp. 7]|uniref:hypothetical protein n=1 Tax=Pseudomonas syringae group genomosp. 7 TaxID=251699 RepID=UPI00376F66E1
MVLLFVCGGVVGLCCGVCVSWVLVWWVWFLWLGLCVWFWGGLVLGVFWVGCWFLGLWWVGCCVVWGLFVWWCFCCLFVCVFVVFVAFFGWFWFGFFDLLWWGVVLFWFLWLGLVVLVSGVVWLFGLAFLAR